MAVLDPFPPLQGAIAYAESLKPYLIACHDELSAPRAQSVITRAENNVGIGVMLGELLPGTWRAAFNILFRPSVAPWKSVKEFEGFRHETRALFYTVREAMDSIRKTAEMCQILTGRKPNGMDRLLTLIDDARRLEEAVFRDWPSFAEPSPAHGNSLSIDESLAESLGVSVEDARQKLDTRNRELNSNKE